MNLNERLENAKKLAEQRDWNNEISEMKNFKTIEIDEIFVGLYNGMIELGDKKAHSFETSEGELCLWEQKLLNDGLSNKEGKVVSIKYFGKKPLATDKSKSYHHYVVWIPSEVNEA